MRNPLGQIARPETVTATGAPNATALRQKELARAVGLIAVAMPAILWALSFLAPLCRQSSISHYYYLPVLGSVFVALLGFISIFMWNYPGHTASDRWMARGGALAAFGVAVFPTAGDGCAKARFLARPIYEIGGSATPQFRLPVWGTLGADDLHWTAAAVLFAILTWFCLWSFRRDNGEGVARTARGVAKSPAKTTRNRIYVICGLIMLGCMAALARDYGTSDGSGALLPPVFLLETLALGAFGVSWLVKGRFLRVTREADGTGQPAA